MAGVASGRTAMIAKIHVAKKQTGLDDATYRDLMKRETGRNSAADCTDGQLEHLLAAFARIGFKPTIKSSGKAWVRRIYAIWRDLQPLLDQATDATLNAFVARQTHSARNPAGIANPEWLDAKEATKVIQGLQGWLARVRAKGHPE